jgi:hypothetical protein
MVKIESHIMKLVDIFQSYTKSDNSIIKIPTKIINNGRTNEQQLEFQSQLTEHGQ